MNQLLKRGILVILLTILLSFSVSAFSSQIGYDWLASQSASDGGYNNDVFTTSLVVLTLSEAGYDTKLSEDWLLSKLDPINGCFPAGACTTADTALATLALTESFALGSSTSQELWFESTLDDADVSGQWALQVITPTSGVCTIGYDLAGSPQQVDVQVNAGKFPSCGNSNFLNLNTCIQANLISNNPGITLDIDCTSIEGSVILSMIFQSSSNYYLLSNELSSSADFQVPNGCFGRTPGTGCNLESSLWTGYALSSVGSDLDTLVYLKERYDRSNALSAALLFMITQDEQYLSDLADIQKADGSFDRDPFITGLAVRALASGAGFLEEAENGRSFLREQQSDNGDWNLDIQDTAMALYGFGDVDVTAGTCFDGIQNGAEQGIDCGGSCSACPEGAVVSECIDTLDCDPGYACISGQCKVSGSDICQTDEDCDTGNVCLNNACIQSECNYDGKCEYPQWDETAANCPSDCSCGDNVCDVSEDENSCPSDCGGDTTTEPTISPPTTTTTTSGGGGFGFIIILFLLLIVLGLGGYFSYKKGWLKFGKKPKKGIQPKPGQPGYSPFTSRLPPKQALPGTQPKNPFKK